MILVGGDTNHFELKKFHKEIQGPHVLFNLLVMLGNFEPTCIVTTKIVTMSIITP